MIKALACDRSFLRKLVWLSSLLMQYKATAAIGRYDIVKLASIGFEGLREETLSDLIRSDSCWLFSYLFENVDYKSYSDIID